MILSLGDCNTLGIQEQVKNAYPEKFANLINQNVYNCGFTMSTCKEGIHFFNKYLNNTIDIITIQYGLVDSWTTFKYSPYVLYYPDNSFRKIARKIVKKYKKVCRNLNLNKLLGDKNVISENEYYDNLFNILNQCTKQKVILIDTVPNRDTSRNENIQKYNQILDTISRKFYNSKRLYLYDYFLQNIETLYLDDGTHINDIGHIYIANKMKELYENWDY